MQSHCVISSALGILRVGQEIEVRPGIVSKSGDGKIQCRPIFSKIVSLFAEQNHLEYAVPGGWFWFLLKENEAKKKIIFQGLIGVGTKIDPTLCRGDRLVGHILGAVGTLPDIFTEIEINFFLLRRLLGVRTEANKKAAKVFFTTLDYLLKIFLVLFCFMCGERFACLGAKTGQRRGAHG